MSSSQNNKQESNLHDDDILLELLADELLTDELLANMLADGYTPDEIINLFDK